MDHDDFYFLVLNLGSVPQEFNFGEIFLHLTFKRMKIIAKKFEKTRRLLKSDVLLPSPSSFLGLPNFETPGRLISTHFAQNLPGLLISLVRFRHFRPPSEPRSRSAGSPGRKTGFQE